MHITVFCVAHGVRSSQRTALTDFAAAAAAAVSPCRRACSLRCSSHRQPNYVTTRMDLQTDGLRTAVGNESATFPLCSLQSIFLSVAWLRFQRHRPVLVLYASIVLPPACRRPVRPSYYIRHDGGSTHPPCRLRDRYTERCLIVNQCSRLHCRPLSSSSVAKYTPLLSISTPSPDSATEQRGCWCSCTTQCGLAMQDNVRFSQTDLSLSLVISRSLFGSSHFPRYRCLSISLTVVVVL